MFEEIIESLPDALLVVDNDGDIVQANSLVEEMFGYPRNEMMGQPVEMLMPERYRSAHCQHRLNYFDMPQTRTINEHTELYGLHRQGHQFAIDIHLSPLRKDDDLWVLAAIRDIRARKKMEDELRHAHDDLEQKIEMRTAELAQSNALLRQELLEHEQMQQLTAELAHVSRLR